jgi:putative transposase
VEHAVTVLQVSERRACRAIGQIRSSSRYVPRPDQDRAWLRQRIIALAKAYGWYGYRTVTDLLRLGGWDVGNERVYTIWRHEGLNTPTKQPKRSRLWRADGLCLRLRPAYRHHVWSYDVVADRTHDGRPFRILNIIDEYTRACLASHVARRIRSQDVIVVRADLFVRHGRPVHIRSDNGPEFMQGT